MQRQAGFSQSLQSLHSPPHPYSTLSPPPTIHLSPLPEIDVSAKRRGGQGGGGGFPGQSEAEQLLILPTSPARKWGCQPAPESFCRPPPNPEKLWSAFPSFIADPKPPPNAPLPKETLHFICTGQHAFVMGCFLRLQIAFHFQADFF